MKVRVSGFPRSGTFWLACALWENFETGQPNPAGLLDRPHQHRFGGAWLSLDPCARVYVVRDFNEVAASVLALLRRMGAELDEHELGSRPLGSLLPAAPRVLPVDLWTLQVHTRSGLETVFGRDDPRTLRQLWEDHLASWTAQSVIFTRYDDLVGDYEPTLRSLGDALGLKPRQDTMVAIDRKVGV
jgi:hypothetical protein